MWEVIMALSIWASPPQSPQYPQAPKYVACIDGHIAPTLDQCPKPRSFPNGAGGTGSGGPRTGGGGGGGLLGGILGGLGL